MATLKISDELKNVINQIVNNMFNPITDNLKTSIKNLVRDVYYPVGKIYITMGSEDPNNTIGGTWSKISGGYIYAQNSTSLTKTSYTGRGTQSAGSGTTGDTTLSINQIPQHNHIGLNIDNIYILGWDNGSERGLDLQRALSAHGISNTSNRLATSSVGGGESHNHTISSHSHNIATIEVYLWKRTA